MLKRSRGPLLVLVGTVSVAVAQWYLVWLFAREGGASAVGAYSTVLAIATPIFVATQLGLRSVFVSIRNSHPWRTYVVLRVLGIVTGMLLMLLITAVAPAGDATSPVLVAAMVAIKSSDSLLDLYYSRFQKARQYAVLGLLGLINAVGTMVLGTLALTLTGSVIAGVWASALVSACVALVAVVLVTRGGSNAEYALPSNKYNGAGYAELVKAGVPLAVAQFLIALTTYVPVLLVELLGKSADVGVYAVASYLVIFANLVGSSVATVVLPSFALTLKQSGAVHLLKRASRLVLLVAVPGLVAIPCVVFFGTHFLDFVYGPGYGLTPLELLLLALASLTAVPSSVYSSVLLALNNYRGVTNASAGAAVAVLITAASIFGLGLPPVTAGCIALFVGGAARCLGLFVISRITMRNERLPLHLNS
ncbi:Heteropolysaccharide repeat unit export protein [Leifsonia rubra CMS 76R]|nr:Heteropolysaccharide repeat unit export protein [Leifsonia rubra CMS 76R]